ncbi:MAG: hypothetical protein ACYDBY_06845 [Thermoanaerobaculia bacterium]
MELGRPQGRSTGGEHHRLGGQLVPVMGERHPVYAHDGHHHQVDDPCAGRGATQHLGHPDVGRAAPSRR